MCALRIREAFTLKSRHTITVAMNDWNVASTGQVVCSEVGPFAGSVVLIQVTLSILLRRSWNVQFVITHGHSICGKWRKGVRNEILEIALSHDKIFRPFLGVMSTYSRRKIIPEQTMKSPLNMNILTQICCRTKTSFQWMEFTEGNLQSNPLFRTK